MQDANGSRFALLLGLQDWGRCRLEGPGTPTLASLWDSAAGRAATPLAYDEAQACVSLAARVGRFRAGSGDLAPDAGRRLGAAADGKGNVYAVVDGGRRIDVRSAGSGRVSVCWPVAPAAAEPEPGDFGPAAAPAPPPPLALQGLAVTGGNYLVAGIVPAPEEPGGLLLFDLLAGGPPLQLAWPTPWRLRPQDMAARAGGGLAVLDRDKRRVWLLDRRLGMAAVSPLTPQPQSDFAPADGSPLPPAAPVAQPWFDLVTTPAGGDDPVALQLLDDGAVAVLDGAGSDGFALISLYAGGKLVAQASTKVVLEVIAPEDQSGFQLRGFDLVLHALKFTFDGLERQRLIVVDSGGNQALAFDLVRTASSLQLVPDASFLPMKRYGGLDLVTTGRASVAGDTGALYESQGRWLPLVAQRRPRYQPVGTLLTPAFDGQDPGCTWHRLLLDACIPPGCLLRVASRCADEPALLEGLPWQDEPLPVLRPDGSELPWLMNAPGALTDAAQGHGSWELLFQRARGRWLQLHLRFEGNELATPRLVALRAWKPRFSYAQRYLPAVYREDATSADFLERFLANFEGQFTTLEDRIASASALFDVRSAPAETLDWLAGWLGLVLDPSLDEGRRRQLIRHAMPLYQYRGTTAALRLAVQLALSRCVPDTDFALPAPSQQQPWGVRVVERFLTRGLSPALLGETTFDDTPRQVTAGARWSLAEGAEGLHRRWRARLAHAVKPDATALFGPLPPSEALRAEWQGFCLDTLGAVPQLAQQFSAAWQAHAGRPAGGALTAQVPTRWPRDGDAQAAACRQAWQDFLAGLNGPLKRWLRRWQAFIARRHLRIDSYTAATGAEWPSFELLPPPATLPTQAVALADWALFETRVEAIAAQAHAFSVLLPIAGPQADAAALAQQVDLAQRVVRLAKPAHTRFEVRPYWALFRLGQIRLGLDTLLGDGSRDPAFAPPLVLGVGHLGAARVAPRGDVPADRLLLEC
jgi:phage tail-like protein